METIKSELEQFKNEWSKLSRKHVHLLNNDEHFHATFHAVSKEPVLKVLKNVQRKSTDDFRVIFEDGRVIPADGDKMAANKILAAFVKRVGAKLVYDLNIKATGNRNLVSKDVDSISQLAPLTVGEGYYIITKTPNSEKIKQITEIINSLNLKAEIEIITK